MKKQHIKLLKMLFSFDQAPLVKCTMDLETVVSFLLTVLPLLCCQFVMSTHVLGACLCVHVQNKVSEETDTPFII